MGSSPGRAMCSFLPCDIWWPVWGSVLGLPVAKGPSRRFRADLGTNLIKHGEIVTSRPCGLVAQWSEYLHGMREVLGSSPDRGYVLFPPL